MAYRTMRVRIPSGSPVAAARSLAAMRLLKAIFPAMSKEATVARLEASAVWMYHGRHVRSHSNIENVVVSLTDQPKSKI